ncbi:MAG: neutral/alkaline non-lysosomal ceramidase N-terminal domain-containing protein [Planctomycetota bacterium]|nr:neutral/alkaline non-lysosomal ceramidase N-terminal domain-containing protein [Planctomycetota bacterium]
MSPTHLKVGVGRNDITPPLGTLLMGYPTPDRTAESVRDPLHATALAFEYADESAIVLSLDVAIVEDVHVAAIRKGVHEKTGVSPGHVTVCAIQTHSAPRTQKVWGWCELDHEYIDKIMVPGAICAATDAFNATVPTRVGIATTQSDVGINRRPVRADNSIGLGQNPWGYYDPEMTVLRFQSAEGPLATLVHYGAHPTVLGSWSRVISRDWPGIMIDGIERYSGAPALFINGAVGDIAPRSQSLGATGNDEAHLLEVGHTALRDAMTAWRSIKDLRDLDMSVSTGDYELTYKPLPTLKEAETELLSAEPNKEKYGRGMAEFSYWSAVIKAHKTEPLTGRPYLQTITRLGPVAIVPFPGEPFAETVLRMRNVSPFQFTLCASTSCGNNAYLCPREAYPRGGYEAWVGRALGAYLLAENIDDILVQQNLSLLQQAFTAAYPALPSQRRS